ncbi:MAG: glucose-1-phosphate cytidylyltransferase [Acidobacteria bacterium]|nr:glucose-1-phosphate cytidylyltransferase [Acidobacteriota bacterium]MDP6663001.1 glucose-1-phosphate cytidylyltransferase [SAR202 cluster bacterium]
MTRVVLLAGGLGTRLAEETEVKPKPMVEIGGRPILWHVMRHYAHCGFKEFCIALGFRGDVIKRYFCDYHSLSGSMTIDLARGEVRRHERGPDDWIVHLQDTGLHTMTGGRLKRLEPLLRAGTFMLTYGDGVSNVDLQELLRFHRSHGRIGTITAVRPPARFGGLVFDGDLVVEFTEKPQIGEGWINGGFMVFEPDIFRYLDRGDQTVLEAHTLERLAADGQLAAYRHEKFWQCMDTLREKHYLESLWEQGTAPWKTWQ